jgi:hypothetical protein
LPENAVLKSLSATSPNSALRRADGALKPEFEVGCVKARVRPLRSSIFLIGESTCVMISIS